MRRMYSYVSSQMKPHHHLRITQEMRSDMEVWMTFLNHLSVFCRPFMDFDEWTAEDINMYLDASGSLRTGGLGAFCENSWTYHVWNYSFLKKVKPSIEYLELYALTVGVLKWIHRFRNRKIYLFCDNTSVHDMVNDSSSHCKNCMILIRILTVHSMIHNVRVFVKYVESRKNELADALSRLDMVRFWDKAPETMDKEPEDLPKQIWPMEKIWVY